MKKILLLTLIAVTVLMSSCVNPDKISFGGIESIQIKGVSTSQVGLDIGINTANRSSHNITLTDLKIDLNKTNVKLLSITLRDKSVLPRKSDGIVTLPLTVRFNGPLGALGMYSVFTKGLEGVTVSGHATVKAGWVKKKWDIPEMSLDELARQSGINIEELFKAQFAQ
jgi:LEA14-like dessication related protein